MEAPQAEGVYLPRSGYPTSHRPLIHCRRTAVEKPCIPDHKKDFGAHRSCSDFDGILMRNTTTRGEACHWILGRLRLPMNPVPLPPLEMTIIVYRQPVLLAECGWGHLERGLESDGFAAGTSDGQTADRSRGFAAVGILITLSPKRTNDSAVGSFLGKELPTGLRLADGN